MVLVADGIHDLQAAAGMVFIEQAVENARKGMGLSDFDQTKTAISAATSGLVMDNYAPHRPDWTTTRRCWPGSCRTW